MGQKLLTIICSKIIYKSENSVKLCCNFAQKIQNVTYTRNEYKKRKHWASKRVNNG